MDAAKQVLRERGPLGFFRGVQAAVYGMIPVGALNFWGYDTGKYLVRSYEAHVLHKIPSENLSTMQVGIAGSFSAVTTSIFMTPADRVKVLMQTNSTKYLNVFDCARQIYREGGLRSLYRGSTATLLRDTPGFACWFMAYETSKKELMRMQGIDPAGNNNLSPLAVIVAGGLAGVTYWTAVMPLDVVKTRYQAAPDRYANLFAVFKELMAEGGARAFVKGLWPAVIRAFPANAAAFSGMELTRHMLSFLD